MNWTTFLIALAMCYLAYYGLNLLYDLLMSRRQPPEESPGELLFFDRDDRPQLIVPEETGEDLPEEDTTEADGPVPLPHAGTEPPPHTPLLPPAARTGLSGPIRSTGAVGLRELFGMAKENLFEYTGAIPYG